jgi:hypothetical protein
LLLSLNRQLTHNRIRRIIKATRRLKHMHTLININLNLNRHSHDHTKCSRPGHLVELVVLVAIMPAVH